MTNIPKFTIKELIEAGVHFGHKKIRWNPKMSCYIHDTHNGVHIIDLQKTASMLFRALQAMHDVVKNNGRILFVGTKRQASELIAESAKRCGQYYINHRWLGGMLTNWKTVSLSINTLKDLETKISNENTDTYLTKKEKLDLSRKADKLEKSLGGIREMGGTPDLLFVIDTNKEHIAISEARKLGIPIIAIVDTNSNPDHIEYPIPGNDDATRSIKLYCRLVSETILSGIQASFAKSDIDLGEAADPNASAPSKQTKKLPSNNKKVASLHKKTISAVVATDDTNSSSTTKAAKKLVDSHADDKEKKTEKVVKSKATTVDKKDK